MAKAELISAVEGMLQQHLAEDERRDFNCEHE